MAPARRAATVSVDALTARVLDERLRADGADAPSHAGSAPTARELLAAATAAHRRAVATALGLPPKAGADAIAGVLGDPDRLAALIAGLSVEARRMAGPAAFGDGAVVHQTWAGRSNAAASELESHGIAFAFKQSYKIEYRVPPDMRVPLARALAAPYAVGLPAARPARVLGAPLQLAHDVAALWGHLQRAPARVKTDGEIYQRAAPKLLAALPPLELHGGDEGAAWWRLDLALDLLRAEGLVRVRLDDRPGGGDQRELVPAGDPTALLTADPDVLRARLLGRARQWPVCARALALAAAVGPGSAVALTGFGQALRGLCELSGVRIDPRIGAANLAIRGLQPAWLAGAVQLGVGRGGGPSAVVAEPVEPDSASGPGLVCQANFELIALRTPSPFERLVLALTCEAVPGQAHVFRLTRNSVRGGERSGLLDGGVIRALERLVGELPQNVARSLKDWTAAVHAPLQLRSAMMLDAGDVDTADALLAGALGPHVVERLGPSLLAVGAGDVTAVKNVLREAGHELAPGLDRISGRWAEPDTALTQAELAWTPDDDADNAPTGKQVSTLPASAPAASNPAATSGPAAANPAASSGPAAPKPVATSGPAAAKPAASGGPVLGSFDGDGPIDVVLDAIESDSDVFIVYAGARGTTARQITPYEVDGAAVHAYCHLRDDDRSFWVGSIREAIPLEE